MFPFSSITASTVRIMAASGQVYTAIVFQGPVGVRLPAGAGRTVRRDDIAIDAQTDQFLCGVLLRTALTAVPTNGRRRFLAPIGAS
jgi:hypothetical protein